MKKYYALLVLIMCYGISTAQIVNIPDGSFKQKLLRSDETNQLAFDLNGNSFKVDANDDNEIELSEALQVYELHICCIHSEYISSLEGIRSFQNLISLDVSYNILTSLDVSGLSTLTNLYCHHNGIAGIQNLNISNCPNLAVLDCSYNHLSNLDVSGCPNLIELNCRVNDLTNLDVSNCDHLDILRCQGNDLINLNIQNNSIESLLSLYGNEDLLHICADEAQIPPIEAQVAQFGYINCTVDSSCMLQTTGFKQESGVVIFPNPVTSILQIQSVEKIMELAVYNMLGQNVLSIDEKTTLDVSALQAGTYLLKIVTLNGTTFKRFSKK